jgi:uncharacterized membrane protein
MSEYERSQHIDAPPQNVYEFLADVRNLPRYVTHLKDASPHLNDDVVEVDAIVGDAVQHSAGWVRTYDERRRIEWGWAEEPIYHGWIAVREDDGGAVVTIHLDQPTPWNTDAELGTALTTIRRLVESNYIPE